MKITIKWYALFWLLALTGFVFLTFLPCLKNGFVYWDEYQYLLNNPSIRNFSPSGVLHLFNPHVTGIYIPLTLLTYSIEYHFFGLSPFIYHADNLLLHLLNVLLVFWFVYLVSSQSKVALITALMFGVCPLRVESVAWVMERKDVLCSFFYLGALISYVLFISNRLSAYFWGSLFLFFCSLLVKPQSISFPLIMFLVDYYHKRAWSKSLILEKLPFCLISAIFLALSLIGIQQQHLISPNHSFKLVLTGYILVLYFIKSFIPFHLSCINPIPKQIYGFFPWTIYASILLFLSMVCFVVRRYLKDRDIVFGSLFYFVLMALPILNMRFGHGLFYEHYTYLPSIGLYFLFATKYVEWTSSSRSIKQGAVLLLGAYILILAWMNFERCGIWKNSMTLWKTTIQDNFGLEEANTQEIDPNFAIAYNGLGSSYKAQGKVAQAMLEFNRAIEINPDYAGAYYNRALIYSVQGKSAQTMIDLNKAIELEPQFEEAYFARGNIYYQQGQLNQAIADYSKVIEINPDSSNAYHNRAVCYTKLRNR